MTEKEARAVERIADAADRIEQFRELTEKRKHIPATMLNELRMARRHVKSSCDI